MRIIVDAMGGDNAPAEIVKGSVAACRELGVDIVLVGNEERVKACLKDSKAESLVGDRITVVNATQVVEMEDDPTGVLRTKKDSSMIVALNMLKNGEGDACISAGSTGALLSGATLIVKRVRGIRRAALAPVMPNGEYGVMLIDCGANVECAPEYLLQFAYMGNFYAKKIMGIESPRIALLNVGTEDSKGSDFQKQCFAALRKAGDAGHFNFVGNMEARDMLFDVADVIVSDGFSGNIALKSMEGMAKYISANLKQILTADFHSKLGALMVKNRISELKKLIDPSEIGGTALLGISKPVIKAHGSSDARAIKNAIAQAVSFVNAKVVDEIINNVELMTIAQE
ncbi:MAG: phosphate acyltransferase PlsX [Clostridia bacterium]|nr:phosphate acyltransferase PlsX [Clostridia bacterium]